MRPSARPEVELLLAVASWEVSERRSDRVRIAAVSPDWPRWLALTHAHRLVPHARRQLAAARVSLPRDVSAELDAHTGDSAVRGLALVRERDVIAAACAARGVRALPFKGPTLALAAYGDAGVRPSVDLDFVVEPAALPGAIAALRDIGYRSRHGMSPAQERTLQRSFGHVEYERSGAAAKVELHTMFSSPRYPWRIPVADVIARASWPGTGGTPTLDPVDDALLQVMHGARHHWQALEWLVALMAVLRRRAVDPARLAAAAAEHRATRALATALGLGHRLLGEPAHPSSVMARDLVAVDEIAAALHRGDPDRWVASPTATDLRQFDGAGDRVRYLAHSLFDPTLREWELVKLPDGLLPLYYPIRLARLALRPFVRR